MNKRVVYLTKEGSEKLRAELQVLKGPRRTEMAARLRSAIQEGDLSENADYASAKEAQAFLEGRILEIETALRDAIIVEETARHDLVAVGSTVIVSEDGRPAETFRLVGVREADPRRGKISNESPIGLALMGKRVGDIALALTPGGEIRMTILEIR
jgi:transcription elongation factor GreA